jgi:sugar lactone lactonase YvrE
MGGREDIAYSDDFGNTWVSTGFASMLYIYQVLYVAKTKRWIAVGYSSTNNTIAYSDDGINWTLSNPIFDLRCYDVIYNGTVYIAVGWGEYSMATSSDGISWAYNNTFRLTNNPQYSYCIFYDGSRYILGSNDSGGNIATSSDGITWVNEGYIQMHIRRIAYNGDTYVAVGSSGYYYSNDLKTWITPATKLTGEVFWVNWNGTNFVIGSTPLSDSTVNIIYSPDGINWTPSDNTQITGTVYGISSITLPTPVARTYTTINTLLKDGSTDIMYCQRYDKNGILYFYTKGFLKTYNNNIITIISGNGSFGYTGDGGQAINASLGDCRGLDFDSVGNIYMTDSTSNIIRKIDLTSGIISTISGIAGTSGNTGENVQASSATLNVPYGLIVDTNDNIYFSCYGSKVIKKISNGIITTVAGNGSSGYTGDGGDALSATFNTPTQPFLDEKTNFLFVADRFNNAIRKIDLNSGIITTVAGNGSNGSSGDGGLATSAQLSAPTAVVLDVFGNIYIGEFLKVRKVDKDGIITTIAGNGSRGYTGDGGDALSATFNQVYNITIGSTCDILISDAGNKSIRILT